MIDTRLDTGMDGIKNQKVVEREEWYWSASKTILNRLKTVGGMNQKRIGRSRDAVVGGLRAITDLREQPSWLSNARCLASVVGAASSI